jgi:hypothetical protein
MESPDEIKAHQRMERVIGERWSRWMNFKKSSSRVEGECPLGGVARKARERLWDSLSKYR